MPSRLDFYRAFIIVLTFLIFPLRQLLQAAPAADYKLVRTTVDHEKKVNTSRSLPSEEMTMSAGAGQFTYIQIWKDGSRQICQYYFTATFDKPPDQLTIGQEFPLNISLTCSASGDIKERPTSQACRYDWTGLELVRADFNPGKDGAVGMNAARNLVTNGSASYVLRVKPGNDKFYICATATLCGPVTLYEYEKIGLEVPGAGTSSKPSGTNNLASGKKDPCATERDALLVASVKARMAWSKLQSVRSAIEELNREWENRRQEAYWSGTLDVAMMAGSVLTRPIAAAFGKEALLKQIVPAAIIESTFKGIAKESLKQFNKYCHDRSLDPSGVIADIAEKGWDSGSRVLVDFAMREIAMQMMDDVSGEKMSPAFRDLLTEEFFKPAAQFAGFMVSLQSALDSAWTAHGKLEDLRLAIKGLRDLETLDARKWEQRMSDLDVARSSVNHCQTIHPESTPDAQTNAVADFHPESLTGGSSQPLRRTAETNPAPPAKGTSVPGSGPSLVLPYNTASLGLRDGAVIVTNINADDYYYSKQGLVAGSRLISVNFQPLSVRTLEDLKKLLTPAGQDMVVLEFLRPDGTKINFPIPVQK